HPANMTHKSIPDEKRRAAGVADSLLRLSVGLEEAEDLIADLKQALDTIELQANHHNSKKLATI
uniref:PLP-dependent transferase n=1 Tax=Serratia marcescens TaxID=615 RepID=UPI0013DA8676